MEKPKDEPVKHFGGINPIERFNNDMLNELRMIRQLLERIAQTSDKPKATAPKELKVPKTRTKRGAKKP